MAYSPLPGGNLVPPASGLYYGTQPVIVFITPQAPTIALPSPGAFVPAPIAPTPIFGSVALTPQAAVPATLAVPFGNATPATFAVPLTNATPLLTPLQLYSTAGYALQGCDPSLSVWPPNERKYPIQVAPWLCPSTSEMDPPAIEWDIRRPPTNARRQSGRGIFASLLEDAQAWAGLVVYPTSATREILVVVNQHEAQREVASIPIRSQAGVRTSDLLMEIYEYFQQPLSDREYRRFCDDNTRGADMLYAAAEQRVQAEGGIPAANWRKGYKRVDMLGAETMWFGAWAKLDTAFHRWALHVGFGRKPQSSGW